MKYRYTGFDCDFALNGDIFEPSAGGRGYVHFYNEPGEPKMYIGIPTDMVELSTDFEALPEEEECENCGLLEKIKEDFIDELRETRAQFCGRRSLSKIDDLIDFVETYQPVS